MPSCVVKCCRNHSRVVNKQQGITFHRFPGDEVWRSDWVSIIRESRKEKYWNSAKYSVACSVHFDAKDLYATKGGPRRVVKFAVPEKLLHAPPSFQENYTPETGVSSALHEVHGALHENEEFVDMTLAADGHFVKCHQMILALASPYFKDLINASYFSGRHPVIFLNKVSHKTLSAILQYIYLGEVLISIEELSELIQTAKELRIKGLEDMKMQNSDQLIMQEEDSPKLSTNIMKVQNDNSEIDDEICYFEVTNQDIGSPNPYSLVMDDGGKDDTASVRSSVEMNEVDENYEEICDEKKNKSPIIAESAMAGSPATMRYTVSNQGSIQMILNRYLYYLKHSNRNNSQQWRCVDYLNKRKCPAVVVTKNNMVRQRISAHVHTHHDQRILKKVRACAIYEAIKDAETEISRIKTRVKECKNDELDITNTETLDETIGG